PRGSDPRRGRRQLREPGRAFGLGQVEPVACRDRAAAAALGDRRDRPCARAGGNPFPGRCPAAVEDGARQCRPRSHLQRHGAREGARRGGRLARAARSRGLRRSLSPSPERRPAQARGAGASAVDEAAAPAHGRAVRLARRDRARPRGGRPRRAGRAREHQRSARDPRSRGGAHPLRRSLSAVAGAAGAHHPALPGADSAAARSRPFAHASRLRTALRAAVGGPLARGGSSGGGGMMRLEPRYAWVRQLAAFAALLSVWEAAGPPPILTPPSPPRPRPLGAALIDLLPDGRTRPHLEATFSAPPGGLALGIVVGIMLGVVAALVPFIAELLEPVMTVLNAIPRVILAPLFVIWLGIGLASKV